MQTIGRGVRVESAFLSFNRIGFPGVVLKWSETPGNVSDPYIVVDKVIQEWEWGRPAVDKHGRLSVDIEYELERFSDWTVRNFSDCAAVQG